MQNKSLLLTMFVAALLPGPVAAQTLDPIYDSATQTNPVLETPPLQETKLLQGSVQKRGHKEHSQRTGELKEGTASGDSKVTNKDSTKALSGSQTRQDQEESKEMRIAWDTWRTKFERKVYARFNELLAGGDAVFIGGLTIKLGNAPIVRYKIGTKTSFACDIYSDGHIHNLRITRSSGITSFDNTVLRAVESTNGKSCLKFPRGSQREKVSEAQSLWISNVGEFHKSNYNDVEVVSQTNRKPD